MSQRDTAVDKMSTIDDDDDDEDELFMNYPTKQSNKRQMQKRTNKIVIESKSDNVTINDNEIKSSIDDEGEDELYELLEYEHKLMVDTLADDVLFIVGRGLGLERLVLNYMKLYSDPKLLVLVINVSSEDEIFFVEQLRNSNIKCQPKLISSDTSIKDRESLYLQGGIHFITSRILVVDLLTDRIPVNLVTGILVYRAHQVLNSYQESFILRLYRERKHDGFVKAFTDMATSISLQGIGQLQRIVSKLYVKKVELVPRFDVNVKQCLANNSPELVELMVELPISMRKIHTMLVDILRTCLKELKQCSTSHLSMIEIDDENVTSTSAVLYESDLERRLEPILSTLTDKQQRLIDDLKQLRDLLKQAEQLDPATLWRSLRNLRSSKQVFANNSGWLFTDTASKIFTEVEKMCIVTGNGSKNVFDIQEPPKWSALKSVLNEIRTVDLSADDDEISSSVLIIAADERVCRQLGDLIKFGADRLKWILQQRTMDTEDNNDHVNSNQFRSDNEPELDPWWDPDQVLLYYSNDLNSTDNRSETMVKLRRAQKIELRNNRKRRRQVETQNRIDQQKHSKLVEEKSRRNDDGKRQTTLVQFGIVRRQQQDDQATTSLSNQQEVIIVEKEQSTTTLTNDDENNKHDDDTNVIVNEAVELADVVSGSYQRKDSLLMIRPHGGRYNLIRHLEAIRPGYVILYHADLATLRMLEIYQATNGNSRRRLRIYLLMYKKATEEERYLMSLQREQQAFEALIREQGTLLAPRKYDTTRDTPPRLQSLKSTRKAGGRQQPQDENTENDRPKVIVDMREFNSELPSVVYQRGTDIIPATLEVGDYILSSDVCIERKSLDDLVQSLQTGRVYKQIEQMLRHYDKSVLLIESNSRQTTETPTTAITQPSTSTGSGNRRRIGPFQGEMSKRCRDIRNLFVVLLRYQPKVRLLWSIDPEATTELFAEIKFDKPEPDVDRAISIRSDEFSDETSRDGSQPIATKDNNRMNPIAKKMLSFVPSLGVGDQHRLLNNVRNLQTLCRASTDQMIVHCGGGAMMQAMAVRTFLNTDFRSGID